MHNAINVTCNLTDRTCFNNYSLHLTFSLPLIVIDSLFFWIAPSNSMLNSVELALS